MSASRTCSPGDFASSSSKKPGDAFKPLTENRRQRRAVSAHKHPSNKKCALCFLRGKKASVGVAGPRVANGNRCDLPLPVIVAVVGDCGNHGGMTGSAIDQRVIGRKFTRHDRGGVEGPYPVLQINYRLSPRLEPITVLVGLIARQSPIDLRTSGGAATQVRIDARHNRLLRNHVTMLMEDRFDTGCPAPVLASLLSSHEVANVDACFAKLNATSVIGRTLHR